MPSRGTSVVMQESRLTKSPTRPIHIPWSLCSHWGGGPKQATPPPDRQGGGEPFPSIHLRLCGWGPMN